MQVWMPCVWNGSLPAFTVLRRSSLPWSAIFCSWMKTNAEVIVLEETGSTNQYAKQMLADGVKPPFLVIAGEQNAGRGRGDHSFYSHADGFYYTLVIDPADTSDLSIVTIAAAVSLYEAVQSVFGIECSIKWINDLYYNNKKTGGILCEAPWKSDGRLDGIIIGIGVNLSPMDFPEELKDKAGSLGLEDPDRNRLAGVLTDRIITWCSQRDKSALLQQYRSRSFLLGLTVSFELNGRTITGTAADINDAGNLIVDAGQIYTLDSGEVSLQNWTVKKDI